MRKITKKILAIGLVLSLLSGFGIMFSFASFPLEPDEVVGVDLLMQLTGKNFDAYEAHKMQQIEINNNSANLLYIPWANKTIISPENCNFNAKYDFELDCPVQDSTPVIVPARDVHRPTNEIEWCKINTSNGDIWIPRYMAIQNEDSQYYPFSFDETKGCYILVKRPDGAIWFFKDVNYVYFNLYKRSFYYSEFFSIPTFNPQ